MKKTAEDVDEMSWADKNQAHATDLYEQFQKDPNASKSEEYITLTKPPQDFMNDAFQAEKRVTEASIASSLDAATPAERAYKDTALGKAFDINFEFMSGARARQS